MSNVQKDINFVLAELIFFFWFALSAQLESVWVEHADTEGVPPAPSASRFG